ncbi:hypothetical protein SeLEV6574_g01676 [Synchytrium endobioticum]|nr:hypothetical protein SeLEV6574_g01676 [Synchytrium endobioticum]
MAIDVIEQFRPSSIDLPARKSRDVTAALGTPRRSRSDRDSLAGRERPGQLGSRRRRRYDNDRLVDHPLTHTVDPTDNLPYQPKPTVFSIVANLKATITVSAEEVQNERCKAKPAQCRFPKKSLSARIREYTDEASEWIASSDNSIHGLAHRLVSHCARSSRHYEHVIGESQERNMDVQLGASDSFGRLVLHTISRFYGLSSASIATPQGTKVVKVFSSGKRQFAPPQTFMDYLLRM